MKKILILLLLVIVCSCSNKNTKVENEIENKNEENILEKKEIINDESKLNSILKTYEEEYDDKNYATTITLNDDNTFTSKLNICNAMIDVKGEYEYKDNKIYLTFKQKTGFDFIDDNQPYIFDVIDENTIKENSLSVPYSCAYVNSYKSK